MVAQGRVVVGRFVAVQVVGWAVGQGWAQLLVAVEFVAAAAGVPVLAAVAVGSPDLADKFVQDLLVVEGQVVGFVDCPYCINFSMSEM